MPRPEEKLAVCPFYSKLVSTPGYANINCISGTDADGIALRFRSVESRSKWYDDYCCGICYKSCVIFQAIETLQEDYEKP